MSDPSNENVVRGILSGASQCLAKSVHQLQNLRDIWQHVIRKRRNELLETIYFAQIQHQNQTNPTEMSSEIGREATAAAALGGGPSSSNPKVVKIIKEEEEGGEDSDHQDIPKKSRFIWTDEFHQIFLEAVNSIKYPQSKYSDRLVWNDFLVLEKVFLNTRKVIPNIPL